MNDDYEVGYKKPPKKGQFKKGKSGNPKGRPAGSKNKKTVFNDVLEREITLANGEVIDLRSAVWRKTAKVTLEENNLNRLLSFVRLDMQMNPELYEPEPEEGVPDHRDEKIAFLEGKIEKLKNGGTGVLVVPEKMGMTEFEEKAKAHAEKQKREEEEFLEEYDRKKAAAEGGE